jgi:hypothetical protein
MNSVPTSLKSYLTPSALLSLETELALERIRPQIESDLWEPLPRQAIAYGSPADELLYGGAAGGGKSDLLLGLAFNEHHRSVIFRRTYPELDDLVYRSQEIGDPEFYKIGVHEWRLPDRRIIRFRHLDKPGTERRYHGHSYDFIGFDELTNFEEGPYLYLLSRARTTRTGQRVRVVATTNPGGPGNDWVMQRWAAWVDPDHLNPAEPGELRWYARVNDEDVEVDGSGPFEENGQRYIPRSRTFIPARLSDNPHFGDDYRAMLMALPEPLRSQLLNGDWTAGMVTDAYQVIPAAWVKAAVDRWHAWQASGCEIAAPLVLGVDVGRGGDFSVLAYRYGDVLARLERHNVRDTMTIAGHAALALQGGGRAVVDVVGIGAGVVDRLVEQNFEISEFSAGSKTSVTDSGGRLRFADVRAAAWWQMRELLDPAQGHAVALPPDRALADELSAPRWQPTSKGWIRVESKEQVKRRLRGRSTDNADAVIHAFWTGFGGGMGDMGAIQEQLSTPSRWTAQSGPRWKRTRR